MSISKIYIFHPYLGKPGGGTFVTLSFAYYFWKRDYPVIYICNKFSKKDLIKFYSNDFDKEFLESLTVKKTEYLNKKIKISSSVNLILFRKFIVEKFIKNNKNDILYIISNPYPLYINKKNVIQYLHAPVSLYYLLYTSNNRKIKNKLYYLFLLFLDKLYSKFSLKYSNNYFVNSNFIKILMFNKKFRVLYPPVFINNNNIKYDKKDENLVVSIQRFAPGKKIELILEIAKNYPNLKFVIFGTISYLKYFKILKTKIKNEKIENVELLANMPREVLKEYLLKANIYLHSTFGEQFGISVVEAMSCGCIPIVPKFSGSYFDILDKGKYGLGYKDLRELIGIFEDNKWKVFENKREEIINRAKYFSFEMFEKRLDKILEEII